MLGTRTHRFWLPSVVIASIAIATAIASCGGNSRSSNIRIVDPDGVTCITEDGSTFSCIIDQAVVEANDLTSTDLADYVSTLSNDGISENSTLLIQAYGGGSVNPEGGGDVSGGVAQTVTTVADFQSNYGTSVLYFYLGLQATTTTGSENTTIEGGGSSTIVSTVDGSSEGSAFDISSNVILIAGGAGGGGAGNYNHHGQGSGGAGGVAISANPDDGNCAIETDATGAVCGSGADGTTGSQHNHDADSPGKGGGGGINGSGSSDGTSGIGGQGGAPHGGSAVGWAGGYSPAYTVSAKQGNGGGGTEQKGDSCIGTGIDNAGYGGGGGGGYGGGGGGGGQETCPSDSSDFVTLGGGGGGGGSFAIVSTTSYSGTSASATSGDGQLVLVFVGDTD